MANIDDLIQASLQQKAQLAQQGLDLQQTQIANQKVGIDATANSENVKAGLMPAESKANIANTYSQAGLNNAQASVVPLVAQSTAYNNYSSGYQAQQSGGLAGQQALGQQRVNGFGGAAFLAANTPGNTTASKEAVDQAEAQKYNPMATVASPFIPRYLSGGLPKIGAPRVGLGTSGALSTDWTSRVRTNPYP